LFGSGIFCALTASALVGDVYSSHGCWFLLDENWNDNNTNNTNNNNNNNNNG
jgi:hypothetical protein